MSPKILARSGLVGKDTSQPHFRPIFASTEQKTKAPKHAKTVPEQINLGLVCRCLNPGPTTTTHISPLNDVTQKQPPSRVGVPWMRVQQGQQGGAGTARTQGPRDLWHCKENLGPENFGPARHRKYWHETILARHGTKHLCLQHMCGMWGHNVFGCFDNILMYV